MKTNILVTGSNGQLGSEIQLLAKNYSQFQFFFTDALDLDITRKELLKTYVIENNIQGIINCAAYTTVDKAETEQDFANQINHIAVRYLAEIAKKLNIRLVHISTDYVFNGRNCKPYLPSDTTEPVNYYGITKLAGENALTQINPENSVIIRTSWVYSSFGNNFVKTMLRLGEEKEELNVIYDQIGVPTYAADLAMFILEHALQIDSKNVEIYHYTNEGVCSWYDFAKEIMILGKRNCVVNPIPTTAFPTLAKRPFYSLMDKASLKKDFSVEIPYWKDSLKKMMQKTDNLKKE